MPRLRSILPILLIALGFASCSCQKQGDATNDRPETGSASPPSRVETPPPATQTGPTDQSAAPADYLSDAAKLIQTYLNAMVVQDTGKADALWSGGKPPPDPGDDLLRKRKGEFVSVRIMNDVPLPVDEQSPPQLLEVPVRLRIETAQGLQRVHGSYRLRFKPAENPSAEGKWEIISASLQPELR